MPGNTFGKNFSVTTFGESHGAGLGVVIDGCPAGLPLSEDDIMPYMERRRPGQNNRTTKRQEKDRVEILSGVFEGTTTGTPIAILIRNEDQRSKDYSSISEVFRPGHADFGFYMKYGLRDYRGGGRSSGRETASRVAAGAVAAKALAFLGINVKAKVTELCGIETLTPEGREKAYKRIDALRREEDSGGGVVTVTAENVPYGIGEPVFEKLDAKIAQAMMSIGAVKAVEIGEGIRASRMTGSQNNDGFRYMGEYDPEKKPQKGFYKNSNHSGGILGGISDGGLIEAKVYFKPTPSISRPQETSNEHGENITVTINGRHDPTVSERAEVVCECMMNILILDELLQNMGSRMEYLKRIYT